MEKIIYGNMKRKLNNLGINKEKLKPIIIKRLSEIEEYILKKEAEYVNGINMIKNSRYTTKLIADETKCSRTTLYNHDQLFKKYIDFSISEFEEKKRPINDDNYIDEINSLNEQIKKMQIRDAEIGIMKYENKQLTQKVVSLQKEKDILYARVVNISKELKELRNTL